MPQQVDVLDAARYLIEKQDSEAGDLLSPLALQKLLYYAQGWHAALHDAPLFDDEVQAWKNGPVVPTIWREFRDHKDQALPAGAVDVETLDLDEASRALLDDIWAQYGKFTAPELWKMTHSEEPWLSTRGDLPQDASSNEVIEVAVMRDFFRSKIEEAVKSAKYEEPSDETVAQLLEMVD